MNKIKYLKRETKGKSILDLGCVAHDMNLIIRQGKRWIHEVLCNNSRLCIGVDIEKETLETLSKKPFLYNMVYGDVECLDKIEEFDIVFAGELIEHLSNLDGFLESVKRNLKEDGKFILTTPNATRINSFTRILFKGKSIESQYHTLTFTAYLINNLLKLKGFKEIKVYYSNADYIANKNYLYRLLSLIRKEFRSNLIIECQK